MADSGGPDEPNTNTPEENRFLEEQKRLTQTRLDLLKAEKSIVNAINSSYSERLVLEQQIVDTELKLEEIRLSLGENLEEQQSAQSRKLEDQVKIKTSILEKAKKNNAAIKDETELVKTLSDVDKARYEQAVNKITEIQAINRRGREASARLSGQIASEFDARTPQLIKNLRDLSAIERSQGLKGLGGMLGRFAGLGALKGLEYVFNAVKGIREEFVEINRVTLSNRQILQTYKDIATDIDFARKAALKFGKSTGDVAKSLTELYKETSAIQRLAEESSTDALANLGLVAAKFEDFGVSSSQTANVIDIAVRNMGMSTEETTRLMESLTGEASLAAQTMPRFIDNFVSQYPKLRIYGDRSREIFTKLNKETSDIGVSMDSIMGVGRAFESYESAAMASTQLNMLLGSNFDALKAMAASPDELFSMLRQNISASDLRQMGHFQRRYLASILQIEYDQLERIVAGQPVEDRQKQNFLDLAESATTDANKLNATLKSINQGIGKIANSFLVDLVSNTAPQESFDTSVLPSMFELFSRINFIDTAARSFDAQRMQEKSNVAMLMKDRGTRGPDADERALVNFALEKGLAAAVSKIEASDTNAETQKTLIDLMTKFVEDKSNVEATNKLFDLFANNKISVEIE